MYVREESRVRFFVNWLLHELSLSPTGRFAAYAKARSGEGAG
jgi:hypothetical protein